MWEKHVGRRHVRAACCLHMLAGACAIGGGRGMWGGHVRVRCDSVAFALGVRGSAGVENTWLNNPRDSPTVLQSLQDGHLANQRATNR